ncbi:MAG: ATP-binding protein [Candidatus Korobacteraceae bacterium]
MKGYARIRQSIVSVLALVFAGFILLILASAYIGLQAMRSIEEGAVHLVEEQRASSSLIDDIQRQEYDLDAIFYSLITGADRQEREQLLITLASIEKKIESITAAGRQTRDAEHWSKVEVAMTEFIGELRQSLQASPQVSPALHASILIPYRQRVNALADLVRSSYENAVNAENLEDRRLQELIRQSQVLLGLAVLLALVGAVLTIRFTTRLSHRLEWQATELARLSASLLENQESTARRFSRELHDEFGQTLSAIEANIIALRDTRSDFAARIEDCLLLVKDAMANVRELSHLLRPSILDDFGLQASLQWLAERFTQRSGVAMDFDCRFSDRLPGEIETHLFRIAQEALTNIARHSGATEVKLALFAEKEMVVMTISDNGVGMGNTRSSHGLGLIGMRARARGAGGELNVVSTKGGGVTLRVQVPVEPEPIHEENPHLISR